MADFGTLDAPILISRKIWGVTEKFCHFHTVGTYLQSLHSLQCLTSLN